MYNKDFRKQMEQFDKEFACAQIWSAIMILLTIAILSGIGFIVFKLLAFFGVL